MQGEKYQKDEILDIEGEIHGVHKSDVSNPLLVTSQVRR
jgi:hypothetical protein